MREQNNRPTDVIDLLVAAAQDGLQGGLRAVVLDPSWGGMELKINQAGLVNSSPKGEE